MVRVDTTRSAKWTTSAPQLICKIPRSLQATWRSDIYYSICRFEANLKMNEGLIRLAPCVCITVCEIFLQTLRLTMNFDKFHIVVTDKWW